MCKSLQTDYLEVPHYWRNDCKWQNMLKKKTNNSQLIGFRSFLFFLTPCSFFKKLCRQILSYFILFVSFWKLATPPWSLTNDKSTYWSLSCMMHAPSINFNESPHVSYISWRHWWRNSPLIPWHHEPNIIIHHHDYCSRTRSLRHFGIIFPRAQRKWLGIIFTMRMCFCMGNVFCATDGHARDVVKDYFWQPPFAYIRVF
jgi:hypothetical protein